MKVFFRLNGALSCGDLEIEGRRAFIVLSGQPLRTGEDMLIKNRIEIDVPSLKELNPKHGAHYIYRKPITTSGRSTGANSPRDHRPSTAFDSEPLTCGMAN